MSLEQALEIVGVYQGDGKILAWGQSLMPLMNMRLARPKVIVDINQIQAMNYIRPMNYRPEKSWAVTSSRITTADRTRHCLISLRPMCIRSITKIC